MAFILAKKLKMSQIFQDNKAIPVTFFEAGPCIITQIKTKEKDGYAAVQIGFGTAKKLSKAVHGHLKECGNFRYMREFPFSALPAGMELKRGNAIEVGVFKEGEKVNVAGISKGKGFQGVVKRHGFSGGPKSHGQKDRLRAPGSIGATTPQRVTKGHRMPGRMGGERVTVKNLKVIGIDTGKHILIIQGSVPGNRGSLVEIKSSA